MTSITGTEAFMWELFGTAILLTLGNGVCAALSLRTSAAKGAGWIGISLGWGLAVYTGASIATASGGHLNPVVTVSLATAGKLSWSLVPYYVTGQFVGAFLGAIIAWVAFKQQFDANGVDGAGRPTDENSRTGTIFFTAPGHGNNYWNAATEFVASFVLMSFILFGPAGGELGPLTYFGVAFIVVALCLTLGSPTGCAINPARDFGPRLAYAFVIPIKGKGSANWSYAWVPILAPMSAAVVTGLIALAVL